MSMSSAPDEGARPTMLTCRVREMRTDARMQAIRGRHGCRNSGAPHWRARESFGEANAHSGAVRLPQHIHMIAGDINDVERIEDSAPPEIRRRGEPARLGPEEH